MGDKGDRGDPGRSPFTAPPGIPGDRGFPGHEGACGPKGFKGLVGQKGEIGEIGKRGQTGNMGPKGNAGDPGSKGFQGQSGTPGRLIAGPKGDMGETGTPGRAGVPGEPGRPGLQGPPGNPGLDDTSGRCPCNRVDSTSLSNAISNQLVNVATVKSYFFASLRFTLDTVPAQSRRITFGNIMVRDGGSYDASTGIFTAPVSGIYQFLISVMPDQGGTACIVLRRLSVQSNLAVEVEYFTSVSGPRLESALGPADPVQAFSTRQILQLDQGDQ